MKKFLCKLAVLSILILGISTYCRADRCETTQNVEISANTYAGTPLSLTYTIKNFNSEQVTVIATYNLISTTGESITTSRNYVIEKGGKRQENFNNNIFDGSGYFKANECGASLSVTICK